MNILSGKKIYKIVLISVFIIITIFAIPAQDKELRYRAGLKITLSQSSIISMITVYPGDQIYSLFGHSAFRVFDPENGIDWMYNYGTFDFTDNFFILKFVQGKLDYYLDIGSFQRAFRFYSITESRKIFEQVLDFDLEERQALFDFLQKNGEPENRVYRYDFIWDNCSTRIADAIDKTFPGFVDYSAYRGSGESFRKMIMPYVGGHPFINFGIQLVFGKLADQIPKGHELFFLPVYMKQAFSAAVIKKGDNETASLVLKESMIASPDRAFHKKTDYPFFIFLSVLIIYFISIILQYEIIFYKKRKQSGGINSAVLLKPARFVSALCEGFVLLFTGIMGLLITYLWFFSDHTIASLNFNYLWCTPLNLILFAGIFLKIKSSFKKYLFVFLNNLAMIMCVAYLACIASGAQYAMAAFFPVILLLITAEIKKYITILSLKKIKE